MSNGSFESPRAQKEYDTYAPGTHIGAWEVHDAPVDLVGTYWRAQDGAQSLNLRGGNTRAYILQDLDTVANNNYVIHFALAGNPDNGPGVKKLEVWWDDHRIDTVEFIVDQQDHKKMGWKIVNLNVKASRTKTRLRFGSANDEPWGPALDDVKVLPVGH